MLISISDFIGRFHPVLVHLPIGILLFAVLLYFLSRREKYKAVMLATGIALFWGMWSAIASAISGFLLSKTAEYEQPLLSRHQWLGIATAAAAILAWYLHRKQVKYVQWILLVLAVLIIVTGHLGGSLTHGSDYLTKSFAASGSSATEVTQKPIPDVQQAIVYSDIIQPILQNKCYSCHGATKQKGKLRLDSPDFIIQGGKTGKTIMAGNADESELLKRIALSHENKKHMPPKEKPQLTKDEVALLHWWISNGADFKKRTAELPQPEKVKPVLTALQSGKKNEQNEETYIPEAPVEKADEGVITKLKERGVSVVPVAQGSHYLSASFVAVDTVTQADMELLNKIGKQLVWLKMPYINSAVGVFAGIGKLTALTRLSLEHSSVTDADLLQLKTLANLQYLNVAGTGVTVKGLSQLSGLTRMKQVYVYQTGISSNDFSALKKLMPSVQIDTGGYRVPVLASDTTLVKPGNQ